MKKVTFAIGSLFGGGAERVVSVWASMLAEKGYKVSVLLYARMENEYPISDKVNVVPIAESTKACNDMSIIKRLRLFRKALKKLKPDVVISFLPVVQVYTRIACIGLRIPRIETVRISPWHAGMDGTKFSKLWRNCFETSKAVILQSEGQKPFFSKKVQAKSVVIPNPINEIYINNEKTTYNASSHKVVAAGRLSSQKNYKMMIDAISIVKEQYKDVGLSIYGVGELEEELGAYIKKSGLENSVKLMGRTNELYKVYEESDVYVMSSDYEGLPNALAEAMAIGLPCVSTDCKTGPSDLIDNGQNGFLIPCGDVNALAEKIKTIFNMSANEQEELGKKARAKIIGFCGEENSLKKLVELVESVK